MDQEYMAKSVHECWTIAFDMAEEYQRQMNFFYMDSKFETLKVKRDIASEIACRIKHGHNYKVE